ncbi:hypothetical protein OIU74_023055 [Salix koriyanagi]|uniref:Reverse transcriptase zinc-binding domain-containing protein n=1 Tax=Salix koriyanagi TaxID=2511006 RepID=A0A9Q1AA87_9ROSI|nr:hypothetical protein OIU74_023055 [Salix koriyanagi]
MAWNTQVNGDPWYCLTSKLRRLKDNLKSMHRESTSNLTDRVQQAKQAWMAAQLKQDLNPRDEELKQQERTLAKDYAQLCRDEESFFRQRSRIQWLKLGDRNTSFFHKSLLHRQSRNRINSIINEEGDIITNPKEMGEYIVDYYKNLLSPIHGPVTRNLGDLRIVDLVPARLMSQTGLPRDAKVAEIIRGDTWIFPDSHPLLQEIWSNISFAPNHLKKDVLFWGASQKTKFTIAEVWEHLRPRKQKTDMATILFFKGHIPRHGFLLWLTSQGKLRTMDRLHGGSVGRTCVLCGLEAENHEHLFFNCTFSSEVWRGINGLHNLSWPNHHWPRILSWAAKHHRKKSSIGSTVARLTLAATVYFIWKERNQRVFNKIYHPPRSVMEEIHEQLSSYMLSMNLNITMDHSDPWPSGANLQ